jgi:ribonuclease HI
MEKNIRHIQVYGDSKLVIKWMNGTGQPLNIQLKIIREQIKSIENSLLVFLENRTQRQIGSQRLPGC